MHSLVKLIQALLDKLKQAEMFPKLNYQKDVFEVSMNISIVYECKIG